MKYHKNYPVTDKERAFLQKFSDLIKESHAWIEYEKGSEYTDTVFHIRAMGITLGLDDLYFSSLPDND